MERTEVYSTLAQVGKRIEARRITRLVCDFGDLVDNRLLMGEATSQSFKAQGSDRQTIDTVLARVNEEFKDLATGEVTETVTENNANIFTIVFKKLDA